ncbi:MAG: excinuclease ABC subunit UvrC [Helicobacteraceae bacterium]|nr:excinuclease ABC subunit UvrC [Helicobacteraceae bacterium]
MINSIKNLPPSAGIYQYFDKNNRLLYIGKAKNLINRVKSYWRFTPSLHPNPTLNPRILKMLSETVSMHYMVVDSENDALILENSLIKQLKPKYNILLRDDKTYPYIYIDETQKYPRFEITRKVIKGKDIKYFGPFSVGANDILDSIYESCKLVQKKSCLKGGKACLFFQIDKCLAPCEEVVTQEKYYKEVEHGITFIKNKKLLLKTLEGKMLFYAEELRFEEAQKLKERMVRIQKSEIKSNIDIASKENFDIFAIVHNERKAAIVRLFMRDGKVISSSHDFIHINDSIDLDEAYERVILEFYNSTKPPIVAPILTPYKFSGMEFLSEYLTTIFKKKATILNPQRGEKKALVDLALNNANELLKIKKIDNYEKDALALKELCSLQSLPLRVECFDNSHMGGVATVGAMVVYEENIADKKSYRHYHLESRDEYGQMRETLTRRIESFEKSPPPDLWIIDGGTTLLSLASDLLSSAGVNLDVIAISKEKIDAKSHRAKGKALDQIHTINDTFYLGGDDRRLFLAQRYRDEAHRFAISFHKKTKLKLDKESQLLNLKGISQAKIVLLLKHFETFDKLRYISEAEIAEVLNAKDAKIIKESYKL